MNAEQCKNLSGDLMYIAYELLMLRTKYAYDEQAIIRLESCAYAIMNELSKAEADE